jgi:hypothetical protein
MAYRILLSSRPAYLAFGSVDHKFVASIRIELFHSCLKPLFHRFFWWWMGVPDAAESSWFFRCPNPLVDLFLNPNRCCSQWPPNNTVRPPPNHSARSCTHCHPVVWGILLRSVTVTLVTLLWLFRRMREWKKSTKLLLFLSFVFFYLDGVGCLGCSD